MRLPLLFSFLQLLGSISVENTEYLLRLELNLKEKNKEKITYDFSAFVEITPENGIICAVLCGAIISENNVIMCSPHKHSSTFFSSLSTYFCRKNHASTSRPCIIYPIVSSQGGKLYRL